jgi:hypothetical protein
MNVITRERRKRDGVTRERLRRYIPLHPEDQRMLGDTITNTSVIGLLGMMVSVGAVGVALLYAISPSERRLALMRPLSLAAIFGGLASFMIGMISILTSIAATGSAGLRGVSAGAAESFVALFVAFGSLTLAWLLVTFGLWRAGSSR